MKLYFSKLHLNKILYLSGPTKEAQHSLSPREGTEYSFVLQEVEMHRYEFTACSASAGSPWHTKGEVVNIPAIINIPSTYSIYSEEIHYIKPVCYSELLLYPQMMTRVPRIHPG